MTERPPKLLDQVQQIIRLKHYSIRTEEAYLNWIKRYILFHDKGYPKDIGAPEIQAFLTYPDNRNSSATSTRAMKFLAAFSV